MPRDIPLVHIINHDKDATMPLEIASLAALVRWHAWFLRNELGKIDEKSRSEAAPVPFLPVQGDLALSTQPLPILGNGEIDYPRRQGVLVHYILGCSPLAEYEYALQKLSNAAWLLQRLARAGEMRDFGLLYHYLLNGENASGIRHVADQSPHPKVFGEEHPWHSQRARSFVEALEGRVYLTMRLLPTDTIH